MPVLTPDLIHLDDVDDAAAPNAPSAGEAAALQAVARWIGTFVAKPHKDLGRAGPVCPFVPEAMARGALWLATERAAGRCEAEIVQLVRGYKDLFLEAQPPVDSEATNYASLLIVFSDLAADRAGAVFDHILGELSVPAYAQDGLVMGGFHPRNDGGAVYNPDFRPFQSPAPFLLMRHAVVSDWKFFLEKEDWLGLWAERFGTSGVRALAEELRRQSWRTPES